MSPVGLLAVVELMLCLWVVGQRWCWWRLKGNGKWECGREVMYVVRVRLTTRERRTKRPVRNHHATWKHSPHSEIMPNQYKPLRKYSFLVWCLLCLIVVICCHDSAPLTDIEPWIKTYFNLKLNDGQIVEQLKDHYDIWSLKVIRSRRWTSACVDNKKIHFTGMWLFMHF